MQGPLVRRMDLEIHDELQLGKEGHITLDNLHLHGISDWSD
jgi:hypothetical protein